MSLLKEARWDEPNVLVPIYYPPWFRRLVIGKLVVGFSLSYAGEVQVRTPKLTLSNRLSAIRAEWGLSRRQLANSLDISYPTVVALERGEYKPSLELALRMGRCFGLPIEEIFSYGQLETDDNGRTR